jgi:hypothetical protein
LPRRHARLLQRRRADQVADCLRLGQVDASSQKRALGKLARLGQAHARVSAALPDDVLQQHRRTMRGNLHHILAGIGIRRGKIRHHRLVQHVAGGNVNDLAEARATRCRRMAQPQQRRRRRQRTRPRKPHHANPSAPHRRRNRHDRILLQLRHIDSG